LVKHLGGAACGHACNSLNMRHLQAWLAALDDFRNWLIREAA
jgi:hypothetical protein